MLRKKQLTQTINFIKQQKEETSQQQILLKHNDKVTVQYIQEPSPQLIKPKEDENHHMIQHRTTSQDDIEIEYLDENPSAEDVLEDGNENYEFEDTFYPNAIHCLLDLYKDKYERLPINGEADFNVEEVWLDIAKNMQESYFEFNAQQVKQKYILLREQYFGLNSSHDIENFDYFEQIHDIYKDTAKNNILKGLTNEEINSTCYKDEPLLNSENMVTNIDIPRHDFKSEEIVHKEHEFIDMVEKELQAMEEGVQTQTDEKNYEIPHKNDSKKNEENIEIPADNVKLEIVEEESINLKRNFNTDENTIDDDEPPKRKAKLNEHNEVEENQKSSLEKFSSKTNNEFTLFQYNEQQERRHREKINLLEKSLKLQEQAIQQQNQLLQELIKRLPS